MPDDHPSILLPADTPAAGPPPVRSKPTGRRTLTPAKLAALDYPRPHPAARAGARRWPPFAGLPRRSACSRSCR